jgi:hypothetical protein
MTHPPPTPSDFRLSSAFAVTGFVLICSIAFGQAAFGDRQELASPKVNKAPPTTPTAPTVLRITNDPGGLIYDYIARYEAFTWSNISIIVDGPCLSACTYVTRVPRACATTRATFGFHEAFTIQPTSPKTHIYSAALREETFRLYPSHIRKALNARGGIPRDTMLYIKGTELLPLCKG